jgi:hypothetical protein
MGNGAAIRDVTVDPVTGEGGLAATGAQLVR